MILVLGGSFLRLFLGSLFGLFLGLFLRLFGGKLFALGKSAVVTGLGSLGGCLSPVVTECRYLVRYVAVAAYGAGVGCEACLGTGGCSYYCIVAVSKRCYLIRYVAVATAGAGVGCEACLGAGGCSYCCPVAVSVSGYYGLLKKDFAAKSTLLTFGKSACCTSGCNCGYKLLYVLGAKVNSAYVTNVILRLVIGVTECANVIVNVAVATSSTSVGGVAAVCAIGCSYYCVIAMTECANVIAYVAVAASGTSISGITADKTIGCGYYCVIVMLRTLICKRYDNVINAYLNELVAILNVKLITAYAGIELNVTESGVSG